MKRLRVLLVCLIVALLCWYPSCHVYCSERSLSDPGQSAGDRDRHGYNQEQDSMQNKVVEEWSAHTSYDVVLETERASALELLPPPKTHHENNEQTVNPKEAGLEEVFLDPETDPVPAAPEPEPQTNPGAELLPQTDGQDQDLDWPAPDSFTSTPAPIPAQGQAFTDPPALAPAPEIPHGDVPAPEPIPDSAPALSADETRHKPTSHSASPAHTGVEVADIESPQPEEGQASGSEAELQSSLGPVDQELRQKKDHGLSDMDKVDNTTQSYQEQQAVDASVGRETDPSVPSKEDIPTFDEWKKQVMEVEKEKSQSLHTSTNGSPQPVKKVQKNFKNNYASVECGAKILSANNEAKSTSAILMENMDLYMLNPCSNKIWFVIELCEPIQVKQLDIANFELFSSTPKDFLVSISDRYPTNKWVKLGTFHARDERTVQSFPLDEQLYAKYVKVELLSHFGSEHFCPLSLIRVFGTSMVEEYEEIADSQYPSERLEYLDEDYDYPPGYQPPEDKASKNLLGSATNAILNMVNNIAANVLGGKPELEGEAHSEANATEETQNETEGSTEVLLTPTTTLSSSMILEMTESVHPVSPEDSEGSRDSSTPSSLSPDSPEDRRIVTLVEDDDNEEPRQSTVMLMEGEEEEEEEEREEQMRREARKRRRESQVYCPLSSFSISQSCMATLPELLHCWCSAKLAKVRQRSLQRRQLNAQTQTQLDIHTPALTHTPPQILVPVPPIQEPPPLTEKLSEPEMPLQAQNEGKLSAEPHSLHTHPSTHIPDTHTTEPQILLEPSRTSTITPHSFSHTSLTRPTPTQEERVLPPIKDAALDLVSPPTFQRVPVPETQVSGSTPTPSPSLTSPLQHLSLETASPYLNLLVPSGKEQPLPTASKSTDMITPPTELPTAPPLDDTHSDAVRLGTDGGDLQRHNLQASQTHREQSESLIQVVEHHRGEDLVDELLLSTNGNGNIHRTATDFYAELQSAGEFGGGGVNGNGALLNGGTVHSSSQKESVFMRLNNRIKALEMNMSLSSRYLEELSQRYRKQMEEMQRAFNKTIIKLQNTSRIAEEQDQKQTDSIQVQQSQLENVTRLMLNLTITVTQLQREVSDRQTYLVMSLILCLSLGLLLCLQCCRSSYPNNKISPAALPKTNCYPSPKRCFSSYDDMSLKRRGTCPLIRCKSFQLSSTEVGPDDLYIVEPLRFSPEKKKKRCKTKSADKVETVKASDPSVALTNGVLKCNGFHPCLPPLPPPPPPPTAPAPPPPPPPLPPLLPPSVEEVLSPSSSCSSKELPLETSSCGSSTHSEELYSSHFPPSSPLLSSSGLCNGHTLPFALHQPSYAKSRQEKRSVKRRKSRQAELRFSSVPGRGVASLPSLQQLIKGNEEISVGTIGVTAVTGHV
ncbi:SUN domain-containing ossification factor isoform X2 [Lampris incognitus]|uniref:SUN domain-containing ossification factor isoform X2 n=1 Tax=Lampris incognitus TaxID=2546036 RepID=UPI0024B4B1F5|nr:SUN domain-containing ossification factor isoform X2 [Lampris incognitus]